jgi:membrane dipeptidase
MKRRDFLRLAAGASVSHGFAGPLAASGARPGDVPTGASAGYEDAFVIDALASPIQFNIPQESLPLRPAALDAVRASGITGVNLTVNVSSGGTGGAYDDTLARIEAWRREIAAHPSHFVNARFAADLRLAKRSGRLGIVFGFQDTVPFGDDLARLDAFQRAGVRIAQLTYNVQNLVGSGSLVPDDGGLTDFGRAVVARLGELRVLVDLSHCGPRTTLEGIEASTRPVSITHSGCSAIFRHPRSKDDETLRLLADRGGALGIYLMPFLNAEGAPTAADVIAHVEHALQVCGEDHVGIGSDQGIVPLDVGGDFQAQFDAVSARRQAAGIAAPREDTIPYVPELNVPRRMELIAEGLSASGHPSRVIEKVLGTNWMRLFEEVWGG